MNKETEKQFFDQLGFEKYSLGKRGSTEEKRKRDVEATRNN